MEYIFIIEYLLTYDNFHLLVCDKLCELYYSQKYTLLLCMYKIHS
jgi:hypothetical protein